MHVTTYERFFVLTAVLFTAGWLTAAPQANLHAQISASVDQAYRLAAGFYSRSQWSDAEQAFVAVVEQYPKTEQAASSQFFAAECQMQQADFAAAYTGFQNFLRIHPNHIYAPRATFRMGESAYRTGRHEIAIRLLEEFLRDHPNHALAEFALPYLGQLRIKRDEPQLAQIAFETALNRYPNGALVDDARLGLAKALQQLGNLPEARRFFNYLVNHPDPNIAAEASLQLGVLALKRFDFEAAESVFRAVREKETDRDLRFEASLWLARTKLEIRDYPAAWSLFQSMSQSLTDHPQSATILFEGAIAAIGNDRYLEAQQWLKKLRESFPNFEKHKQALKLEIQTLTRLDRLDEAITLAQDHSLTETLTELQVSKLDQLGRQQYESGEFVAAVETFGKLSELESTDGQRQQWQYLQSLSLLGAARYDAAERTLESLIQSDKIDPEFRPLLELALANAQFGLEKYLDAESHYRSFLQSNQDAPNLRAQLELIICVAKQGDASEADRLLEKLTEAPFQPPTQATDRADFEMTLESIAAQLMQAAPKIGLKWLDFLAQRTNDESLKARIASQIAFSGSTPDQIQTLTLDKFIDAINDVVRSHKNSSDPIVVAAIESALARARRLESKLADDSMTLYRWVLNNTSEPRLLNIGRHRLARLLIARGGRRNLTQAQTLLHRFLKTNQNSPESGQLGITDEVIYQLGWLAIDLDNPQEGYRRFEELLANHDDSKYWSDAAYRLIQYRVSTNQYASADELIEQLLIHDLVPEEIMVRCLFLKGKTSVAREDWQQLADSMNTLLELPLPPPMQAEARYWLAESHYRREQFEQAELLLEQLANLTTLKPTRHPWVRLRLAQCLVERQQWSRVEALASQTLASYPDFENPQELHFLIARGLETRGLLTDAREKFNQAIEAASSNEELAAMAQWRIGETFFHQEDYVRAIAAYYKVDSLYEFSHWRSAALLQAGKCQEHLRNPANASKLYRQLLTKFPNSQFAGEAKTRLARLPATDRFTQSSLRSTK